MDVRPRIPTRHPAAGRPGRPTPVLPPSPPVRPRPARLLLWLRAGTHTQLTGGRQDQRTRRKTRRPRRKN
ncbi:hypothetical protein ACGFNX_38665, partial [Streptomyces sp. NPDC048723]|uniref:hypothetical protein n=1 Tax=Streptomyces sp. NPDC048723 TaxID=3365589 RepID=UPI003722CAB9